MKHDAYIVFSSYHSGTFFIIDMLSCAKGGDIRVFHDSEFKQRFRERIESFSDGGIEKISDIEESCFVLQTHTHGYSEFLKQICGKWTGPPVLCPIRNPVLSILTQSLSTIQPDASKRAERCLSLLNSIYRIVKIPRHNVFHIPVDTQMGKKAARNAMRSLNIYNDESKKYIKEWKPSNTRDTSSEYLMMKEKILLGNSEIENDLSVEMNVMHNFMKENSGFVDLLHSFGYQSKWY